MIPNLCSSRHCLYVLFHVTVTTIALPKIRQPHANPSSMGRHVNRWAKTNHKKAYFWNYSAQLGIIYEHDRFASLHPCLFKCSTHDALEVIQQRRIMDVDPRRPRYTQLARREPVSCKTLRRHPTVLTRFVTTCADSSTNTVNASP